MTDKLATLVRLHRWRLDEQRRLLGAAIRNLTVAEQRVRALEEEVVLEQQIAGEAPDSAAFYGAYALALVARRKNAAQAVADAEAAVAERRTSLTAAWRALRTFELAEESRRKQREEEAARRERLMLDEIAILARARADAAGRPDGQVERQSDQTTMPVGSPLRPAGSTKAPLPA